MRARPVGAQALNFVSARLGGTGKGFTANGKEASPYYLSALKPGNSLGPTGKLSPYRMHPNATVNATEDAKKVDTEAVRARARIVTLNLLHKLNSKRSSMDVSEIVDAVSAVGKLTGAQSVDVQAHIRHTVTGVIALPEEDVPTLPVTTVQARIMKGQEIADPPSDTANSLSDNDID